MYCSLAARNSSQRSLHHHHLHHRRTNRPGSYVKLRTQIQAIQTRWHGALQGGVRTAAAGPLVGFYQAALARARPTAARETTAGVRGTRVARASVSICVGAGTAILVVRVETLCGHV